MPALPIAITQPTITADPRRNGAVVRALMRAAAAKARLIHFPEGFVSGYAKKQIDDWSTVDRGVVGDQLEQVMLVAGELALWVVLGPGHPLTPPAPAAQQPLRDLAPGTAGEPVQTSGTAPMA
jgi:predicted amidohydrolase